MLSEAKMINNYNFRSHAVRMTEHHFEAAKNLQGAELQAKYDWGLKEAERMRRIRVLGELYPTDSKSVMEN